jgi:hypothetical protein
MDQPGAHTREGLAYVSMSPQRDLAVSQGFGRVTSPHSDMPWWKRCSTVFVWSLATGELRTRFQGPAWQFSSDGNYALALSPFGVYVLKIIIGETNDSPIALAELDQEA